MDTALDSERAARVRDRAARICLVGATDDTGNLGVSALMHAVVAGLAARVPDLGLTVFDNGTGIRRGHLEAPRQARAFTYDRVGMRLSRRLWQHESLWRMRVSTRFGGLANEGVDRIRQADAVWDLSAGDSFGVLYGQRRWSAITQPKRLAIRESRLFLLPQTYGPFHTSAHRRQAQEIVRGAAMAWARDPDSFDVLADLLGKDLDERRHRLGVDVAFGLQARAPLEAPSLPGSAGWDFTVGLNVSGLLYNDPEAARRYGLTVDYRRAVWLLLRHLLETTEATVVLVPHVRGGGTESDDRACRELLDRFPYHRGHRLSIAPPGLDAAETKWLIGGLDWFCGTRMHSTIAALSSGVPAGAIAYSHKTRGVFATCGVATEVADARKMTIDTLVAALIDSFDRRDSARTTLSHHLPGVMRQAECQLDELLMASVGTTTTAGPAGAGNSSAP